jgi:hypothetical protein
MLKENSTAMHYKQHHAVVAKTSCEYSSSVAAEVNAEVEKAQTLGSGKVNVVQRCYCGPWRPPGGSGQTGQTCPAPTSTVHESRLSRYSSGHRSVERLERGYSNGLNLQALPFSICCVREKSPIAKRWV